MKIPIPGSPAAGLRQAAARSSRLLNSAAGRTSTEYRGFAHGVRKTDELGKADRPRIFTKLNVFAVVVGATSGSAIYQLVFDDPVFTEPPVTSEIDPAVEKLAEMSPLLRQQLVDLRAAGWTIGYGAIDLDETRTIIESGETRRGSKTIVLDDSLKSDPLAATSTLAHEIGHAYPGRFDWELTMPFPDEEYSTWLERNIQQRRLSEAESELVAAQVRQEIMDAGGPDIGGVEESVAGLYMAASEDLVSRDEARELLTERGDWYPFDSYKSDYEKLWDKYFAETHGPSVEQPDPTESPATPSPPPVDPVTPLPSPYH